MVIMLPFCWLRVIFSQRLFMGQRRRLALSHWPSARRPTLPGCSRRFWGSQVITGATWATHAGLLLPLPQYLSIDRPAGAFMIRRIVGIAGVADLDGIADAEVRLAAAEVTAHR